MANIWDEFDKAIDTEGLTKDVEEAAENGGRREVPHDTYEVAVTKLELTKSKKGDPMVTAWMKIVEGEYKGSLIFMNQVVTQGFQIHIANEFLRALVEEMAEPIEAFIGYTDNDIYGVEVDFTNKKFTRLAGAVNRSAGTGFDSINAFGGRKRCNVANDGTVTAYYGEAGFVTTGKNSAGNAVQVMVEQPKFYYKVVPMLCEKADQGMKIRKARYYVSDTPKAGFKVHPAFVENGKENDKIYLAAFEGSLWDNSANAYILDDSATFDNTDDMLSSIANAKPISGSGKSLTRKNTRLLAEKRGSGWEQAYK